MQLKQISLYNFRRFKGLKNIQLDQELTVFAANNGAGKTTVLDAIALAFGAFLSRLPKISGNSLSDKDICITREDSAPFAVIGAETFEKIECREAHTPLTNALTWQRLKVELGSKRSRHLADSLSVEFGQRGLSQINALADYISEHLKSEIDFPILAYYGTGRAILEIPQRRRGFGKDFPRLAAYENCLNPRTNFKKLFEHFYFLEDMERREKVEKADLKYENPQLSAIREAIQSFLHGKYTNPRTALRPLRFILDDSDGTTYSIEQLSDGYKTSLAMVMDIASRAVEANPHMGKDALNTEGIVLIDEIELHLHPSWQQRILLDLQRTFPNIQFICTTHSPQVLSTVKQESIRLITDEGNILTGEEVGVNTYGAQSYLIMEDLMNVSPNPRVPEVERLKAKLMQRIEAEDLKIDDTEVLELENMVGIRDPFLRNLKVSIIKKSKQHA
jgi:predicted ATP-binding protein involved in virulence